MQHTYVAGAFSRQSRRTRVKLGCSSRAVVSRTQQGASNPHIHSAGLGGRAQKLGIFDTFRSALVSVESVCMRVLLCWRQCKLKVTTELFTRVNYDRRCCGRSCGNGTYTCIM